MKLKTSCNALPLIMAAPNGARRTKRDHPALPVTIAETVAAAKSCFEEGAGAIHAHVRRPDGTHVLDAGLYRALLAEMRLSVPRMRVQITTEAAGIYDDKAQRDLVDDLKPSWVSIAVTEMVPHEAGATVRAFYERTRANGTTIQHILYHAEDLVRFFELVKDGTIPGKRHQLLFVLGRYAGDQESTPSDLTPYLNTLETHPADLELDWAVCAFGHQETDCLVSAIRNGGKARIGLENGLWNRDGLLAENNADRVRDLVHALENEHWFEPEELRPEQAGP